MGADGYGELPDGPEPAEGPAPEGLVLEGPLLEGLPGAAAGLDP